MPQPNTKTKYRPLPAALLTLVVLLASTLLIWLAVVRPQVGKGRSEIVTDFLRAELLQDGQTATQVFTYDKALYTIGLEFYLPGAQPQGELEVILSDADTGEDKMVKGAKREHKTVMEIAQYYTDAFFADCKKLNIKRPDVVQPATGCIDEYIRIIEKLMDTGYAYFAGGNVYFDTSRLDHYYVFNDHDEDDLAVGVREGVEEDTNKRNKNDFVLWFTKSKFENQALKWDSPWGVGYPGWHIECSGISMKYNGEYLDLHCGGVDNAFPHHTNEIAQSESYLGHAWCPQWFHVHHLNTSTGKMSKSKGEFLTVSLLEEKGYDAETGKMLVCVNPEWFRPTDVDNLWGDPTKAKTVLGWNPQKTTYAELVEIMAKHDRQLAKHEKAMNAAL